MKRKTFKAVAYEHSHDTFADVYCLGEGVAFSDSVAKAIAVAKDRALLSLEADEAKEKAGGTPILATIHVFKNGKEIINETY
jgi:hypothetical protein